MICIGVSVLGCRLLSLLDQKKKLDPDDVNASLALMYGYVASYAPSSDLKARIEPLVVSDAASHLTSISAAICLADLLCIRKVLLPSFIRKNVPVS